MLANEIKLALAVKNEKELLSKLRVEATSKKIPIIDDEIGAVLELICFIRKPKNIEEVIIAAGITSGR